MTITKKGETPVKESCLLASPEPYHNVTFLLLWNIFQYCTGAMSRGRLIGLITAVFTPFGLYTIIKPKKKKASRNRQKLLINHPINIFELSGC